MQEVKCRLNKLSFLHKLLGRSKSSHNEISIHVLFLYLENIYIYTHTHTHTQYRHNIHLKLVSTINLNKWAFIEVPNVN